MGTPVVANIVHSGAWLYVAPVGEANPDETTVALGAAWGGNWVRMGFTKAPFTEAYESEEFDIEVEEELSAVERRRVKENVTWETTLAELTAAYVQLAASNQNAVTETAAGVGQKAYEETGIGGVSVLTKKKWGVEMMHITAGGDQEPIRHFMHIGTAKVNGNLEFSKKSTNYPGIAIQIKGLTDTMQIAGRKLQVFQRVTAEAT